MKSYCQKCELDTNYNPVCTGACKPPFGVRVRVKALKVPLNELIEKSRKMVDAMTPEQKAEMIRVQGEGWARAEAQWAKDFREGKCERD